MPDKHYTLKVIAEIDHENKTLLKTNADEVIAQIEEDWTQQLIYGLTEAIDGPAVGATARVTASPYVVPLEPNGKSLGTKITAHFVRMVASAVPPLTLWATRTFKAVTGGTLNLTDDLDEFTGMFGNHMLTVYRRAIEQYSRPDHLVFDRSALVPFSYEFNPDEDWLWNDGTMTGWWLNGAHRISVAGRLRVNYLAPRGTPNTPQAVEVRRAEFHVDYAVWRWYDEIDAKRWADNVKKDCSRKKRVAAAFEQVWDWIGDGLLDTDFRVVITAWDRRTKKFYHSWRRKNRPMGSD